MEIEGIDELKAYAHKKFKELGLSYEETSKISTTWHYDDTNRRIAITRRWADWLGMELTGRWHFKDKKGIDYFIENHVKPLLEELKRQEIDGEL